MEKKLCALSMSQLDWSNWFSSQGSPRFHGEQLMRSLYVHGQQHPGEFTTLPKALREKLALEFDWSFPGVDSILSSQDGSERLLLKLRDGLFIECVVMPSPRRVTLCVSSQVGCRMACTFCQTGKMGFTRHLSLGEILIQLTLAQKRLLSTQEGRKITHIVFMGMGEPLDNYDNVVHACKVFLSPALFGLSKNRVTVSTSGLVPQIERLGQDIAVSLAISLHVADEAERSALMPVNKKYSLALLKEALLRYPVNTRHGITFEYVLINGVNDSLTHARKLVKFLHGLQAKVNLIPMNPHPGTAMVAPDESGLRAFQKYLSDRSIPAPVRYSRGQDVSAACGQLAAKRQDELSFAPRRVALARRQEYLKEKGSL